MIFDDWIQRRVATLLHPWLRHDDDPHLELKLGVFRSNGTLTNISLDASKLNESLDDPSAFCFREVSVEHLSLHFSPFSSAAFTLVVRGVRVVLTIGEEQDEGGVNWRRNVKDTTMEERNKVLEEIDPEGCALHGSIKKISEITTRKWRDSLLNTVLGHCQLQLLDVHVLLQSPSSHDPLSCSLYIEKIAAGSQKTGHKCFARGFLSSIFVSSEGSSFGVDVNGFKISLNSEKHTSCVVPSTDMFVLVNMIHLQFTSFCFRVPALKFLLSTRDLSLMLLFCELLSKELKCTRPGKQLWNIVASRISSLTPNMSLIKVVRILCQWLRYIKNYKRILLLIGYPADEILRKSTTLMLRDARYSKSVKSQWKIINEIEKDMPLEAIILARRIIRSTVASTGENEGLDKLVDNGIFSKLHQLIVLILSTVIVLLHKILDVFLGVTLRSGGVHEDFVLRQGISLNIHEIEVSVSPDIAVYSSVNRKAVSERNLLSFHLSIDGVFLRHLETISEQRLTFASGCMKVLSSSLVEIGATNYARIHQEKKLDEKHIIILGEPAQSIFSEPTHNAATDEICDTSVPHLASLLGKLWLNWQDSCLKSEGEYTPNVQNPWILCDIRSSLTDQGLNPRFLDCALVVGRVNFTLEYFAITPIVVLFRQIQDALCLSQKNIKMVHRQTPNVVVKDLPVRDWFSKFRSFSRKIEMDIIRMLPEMHVQIGVLVAGPQIQISFLNDTERTSHQLVWRVTLNICNIELLVSPNLEDNIGLSHERIVEPESESDSKDYSCQGKISCNAYLKLYGLKIYIGESTTNQKYQIVVLSPMTTQLNYLRKDHYSLGSSIVSFSAALDWVTTGFSSLIFLDELCIIVKIVYGVFYESLAPSKNGLNSGLDYEDRSGEAGYVESDSGEKYFNKSHELLLAVNTQFIARTTSEIKSFDVILHNSRKVVNQENYINMMSTERGTGRKSTMVDFSGNGIYISLQHCNMEFVYTGGNIDAVIDTTGVRLTIFRYLTESEETADKSELKNLLRSLNFLTEASVSHTKLRLSLSKHMFGEASSVVKTERHGDRCLLITVVFSGLYMAGCKIKDILVNQNNFEKLSLSFSAGEEFRKISCHSKGGYVLLEATAAMMLIKCFLSYYLSILELWPATCSSSKVDVAQSSRGMAVNLVNHPCVNPPEVQIQELLWDHIELVSMNLSHLSLVLVATDKSGMVQELLLEGDFHLNFERLDTVRKLSTSISKLSLLSRFMHGAMKHRAKEKDGSMSVLGQNKFYGSPLNYILRDMQCLLAVEGSMIREQINPVHSNSVWVGNGSISGLEITISLSEIKMMLSALESVSGLSIKDETRKPESNHWSYNEDSEENIEEMVTDGSVVAIQDVDQHTYITVEGAESRYDIAGTIHYSLVGKRSLFRVKYHNSRWNSKVKYFSLISLYAKDESGEPLRLNSSPRSRFVGISCPNDGGSALWTILPFKADQYEDVSELEPCRSLSKKRFHLVNKKSDCAIAFINGVLELIGKPGNLFKWKVLSDPEINQRNDSNDPVLGEVRTNGDLMGITVTVDKVTLTVVHELSDTEEKFLLLQGSIIPNQVIMQITNSKVRFMSSVEVAVHYFDAHWNSWMDFIQPIEISTFYCFKFPSDCQENTLQGVPGHFYAKIKEVNILVTERALDILLFVIGELELAGPYAIKSSVVLANCCKVENQSGLTLHCQFYDNQDVSVSPRQSTTTFLRHLALANRPPEASFFSVQLLQQGSLSTSPIHLSLSDARQFAWRTRIASSQDSKSFPGPFIAIELSRRIEGGLSIIVSPSLRIHNETDFSLELRFQRPDRKEKESASLMLKAGSIIDDAMTAFSAIDLSGGSRKALTSLSVGNYVFSFRPNITDDSKNLKASTVEWSDDLKGEKPVRLSGIFDKLTYQVRKAFSVDSVKVSLTSANCSLVSENGSITKIHFLIQTIGKSIPVINPDNFGYAPSNKNSPVAMQEQKEIFVLPTVEVTNLLHTEIHVSLTDTDPGNGMNQGNPWSRATIPYGVAVNFYANPSSIYFVITLISFGSSCTPVNSSDWVRKLQKKKGDIRNLDIELEFGGGKYFAMLRLSRRPSGTLKVVIFTPYALQNDTNTPLFCVAANKKPSPRADIEGSSLSISPDLGSYLPPNSVISWFLKCNKLHFKLLEEKALETELDLDALSGLTEIDLESEGSFGSKIITRLGVSLRPLMTKEASSQIISLRSRYVICNESEQAISVRQCYIEDMEEMIAVNSKQRVSLRLKTVTRNKKETSVVDKLLRKHTKPENDVSLFIQFRPNETGYSWSGPICVASLGRFSLKFRQSDQSKLCEFATVHVVEEGSTIVLQFDRSKRVNLPYKIENVLRDAPVTYYQKDSSEPETLGAGGSVDYVWDDLTLPHKLVIQLDDVHLLREINLDKVRAWKPFYRNKQIRNLGIHLPLSKRPEDEKGTSYSRLGDTETVKVGYEIYAEGMTRVLRICEFSDRRKVTVVTGSSTKMRLRISYLAVHLLEHAKQDIDLGDPSSYAPIIITRFERLHWDSLFANEHKYNQIRLRSLSVDEKWEGAPFAAMLRRHQTEKAESNDYILHAAVVLLPMCSGVKPVKYLSIVLQPLDLNLDEETLMKIVPFWRKSLSQSTSRQQYYFDHFEIHPIKIIASFLPGDSNYSYSSTQETLRSLLHSVIKIPAIKSKTIELNGVLVTHALITLRELSVKCAQHYSWYAMRAIYIAKGSPLLPPAFASVFDDLASSSLDVFFDPSSGVFNLPGVTLGTLKLISKFIDNKGISGTKRYFGDLGKTLKTAGSNMIFAAITEVSDSVLKGAETSGFGGLVNGFHQGILKIAMEPSVLGSAFMEGGPDRKIKLGRSPGVDELYIEGYLQAMLDTMYKQEYLRVRVIENQVILKNLPPSSSLIEEIMENVKDFLASKALLKGRSSTSHSLRHIRGEREWRIGPTVLTLCEHLFVSFVIQALRKQSGKFLAGIKWKGEPKVDEERAIVPKSGADGQKMKLVWRWGIGKFLFSGIVAYVDGRLCRNIPHPLARRIVSGFLLSFLDRNDDETK